MQLKVSAAYKDSRCSCVCDLLVYTFLGWHAVLCDGRQPAKVRVRIDAEKRRRPFSGIGLGMLPLPLDMQKSIFMQLFSFFVFEMRCVAWRRLVGCLNLYYPNDYQVDVCKEARATTPTSAHQNYRQVAKVSPPQAHYYRHRHARTGSNHGVGILESAHGRRR